MNILFLRSLHVEVAGVMLCKVLSLCHFVITEFADLVPSRCFRCCPSKALSSWTCGINKPTSQREGSLLTSAVCALVLFLSSRMIANFGYLVHSHVPLGSTMSFLRALVGQGSECLLSLSHARGELFRAPTAASEYDVAMSANAP